MWRDDATKQPFDLCSRPSESALRPPISNERARRPERERARWTRSEARDEGARRIITLRRAEVEKPQSGGCCQTALSPPCALGRPQLSRLLVKGLPTGGGRVAPSGARRALALSNFSTDNRLQAGRLSVNHTQGSSTSLLLEPAHRRRLSGGPRTKAGL